jgi:hypothetical protein
MMMEIDVVDFNIEIVVEKDTLLLIRANYLFSPSIFSVTHT